MNIYCMCNDYLEIYLYIYIAVAFAPGWRVFTPEVSQLRTAGTNLRSWPIQFAEWSCLPCWVPLSIKFPLVSLPTCLVNFPVDIVEYGIRSRNHIAVFILIMVHGCTSLDPWYSSGARREGSAKCFEFWHGLLQQLLGEVFTGGPGTWEWVHLGRFQ